MTLASFGYPGHTSLSHTRALAASNGVDMTDRIGSCEHLPIAFNFHFYPETNKK